MTNSNLPKDTTKEDLTEFFSDCGAIREVSLPTSKTNPGEIRGFAIIVFETEAGVINALKLNKDRFKDTVSDELEPSPAP